MAVTSASPDKNSSSSSVEGFAGFNENEMTTKKLPFLNYFNKQSVRVSQPRTSKSRASLVWKKEGKSVDTTKEAPKEKTVTKKVKKAFIDDDVIKDSGTENIKKAVMDLGIKNSVTAKGKKVSIKQKEKKKITTVVDHGGIKDLVTTKGKKVSIKQKVKKKIATKNTKLTPSLPVKQKQTQNITDETEQTPGSSSTVHENANGGSVPIKRKRQSRAYERIHGFKCKQCGKKYKYYRGMQQHQKLECNKEPQFPCPYCPSKYRYRQNIREHVRSCHELAFPKWYATHYVVPHLKKLQNKM